MNSRPTIDTRHRGKRSSVLGVLAVALSVLALAGTLSVATSSAANASHIDYKRSTLGAYGHGNVYKSNGYVYNSFFLKDTVPDGHCVYMRTTWQERVWEGGRLSSWKGLRGDGSDTTRLCGYRSTKQTRHKAVPRHNTGAIRALVKVCVDRPWYIGDRCSSLYIEGKGY